MDTHRMRHDGRVCALIISGPSEPGMRFLTGSEEDHQVGAMRHGRGHVIAPHTHPTQQRTAHGRSETLLVIDGEVDAVLCVDGNQILEERLEGGDVLVVREGELTLTADERAEYAWVSSG